MAAAATAPPLEEQPADDAEERREERVRLFVGGLPAGVAPADVAARFKPFGLVLGVELAPAKRLEDGVLMPDACRGFGYVDLQLADSGALRRCLTAYNGAKWRGHMLRVEMAREHYTIRIRKERAEEAATSSGEAARTGMAAPQQDGADRNGARGESEAAQALPAMLFMRRAPRSKALVQVPWPGVGVKRCHFPPGRALPLDELQWQGLPPPPQSAWTLHQEGLEAALQQWRRVRAAASGRGVLSRAPDTAAAAAHAKPLSNGGVARPKRQANVDVVDFMGVEPQQPSPPRAPWAVGAGTDLSRFDSDSDDVDCGVGVGVLPQVDGGWDASDDADSDGGVSELGGSGSGSDGEGGEREQRSAGEEQPGSPSEGEVESGQHGSEGVAGSEEGGRGADGVGEELGGSAERVEGGGRAGCRDAVGHAAAAAEAEIESAVVQPVLACLREGARFWRAGKPLAVVEAEWRVAAPALTGDYKRKQRDAIKHAARRGGRGSGKRARN